MAMRRWLATAGVLGFLLFVGAEAIRESGEAPAPPRKEKLPLFRAQTADGKRISSEDFFKDHPVVLVDFWALWCRDCLAFMPKLQELKKKYGKDLLVVSLNTDTSQKAGEVASYVKSRKYDFLVLLDPQQKVKQLLGVKMLPTMILVSWDGTIVDRIIGTPPKLKDQLDKTIAESLKSRPAKEKQQEAKAVEESEEKDKKSGAAGSK